jgi:hypothetical protein
LPPLRHIRRRTYELPLALLAIVAITAWYVWQAAGGVPAPGSTVGLFLGCTGLALMLSTETLYSLRKRWPRFHVGRMSTWLQLHIFTGLVGPYLVLLHSAWKFHGLAGVLLLFTLFVVVSGFVGRYIYTAVPRSADGAVVAVRELEEQITRADRQLQAAGAALPTLATAAELPASGWVLVFGRPLLRWRLRRRLRRLLPGDAAGRLASLILERQRLQMQIRSLAAARRLLARWHVVHMPLNAVVFTLAALHVGGALYYGVFLK